MSGITIAVLGAGNAGWTFAADLTLSGLDVHLFELPRFKNNLEPLIDSGGIELAGVGRTGFAKVKLMTTDIAEALEGVKVVLIAMPAYGHAEIAKVCAPYLRPGQIVVLNPGYTLGTIEVASVLIEEGVDFDSITLCETPSLLYATRKYLPNRVFCRFVKGMMPIATFPATKTREAVDSLKGIYEQGDGKRGVLVPLENILLCGLINTNPIAHLPMMILKAVDVELGEEPYLKCGSSDAVRRMRKAMSREYLALQRALGFKLLSRQYVLNGLMEPPDLPKLKFLSTDADAKGSPEWAVVENQEGLYASGTDKNLLQLRYLTEDVPYALVGLASLGDMLRVETPVIDSCITIASVITGKDFLHEGRSLKKLGLSGLNKVELLQYVTTGQISGNDIARRRV